MEEPMDIDVLETDFDNKENTIHHNNVLPRTPCTEKGYEELDVSELNMKLRYSITPASSPMSKSFNVNCTDIITDKIDNSEKPLNEHCSMTRSLNTTITDSSKYNKTLPLLALATEVLEDNIKSVLQPLTPKCIDNVTITVDAVHDDDNFSLPSTTSSLAHTPDAITPTKEMPKDDGGSPIMRGIKSVFSIFRTSQSPIAATEEKTQNEINAPEEEALQLIASTPISSQKLKDSTSRKSPHKESITFTDDLQKELQWKDETTIIFSHEKIPICKLFPEEKPLKLPDNQEVLDDTVEFMDISYNDSALGDKTITNNQSIKNINKSETTFGDSDGEFVDCETTFTKDNSLLDLKKDNQDINEHEVATEAIETIQETQFSNPHSSMFFATNSETNEISAHLGNNDVVKSQNKTDESAKSENNITDKIEIQNENTQTTKVTHTNFDKCPNPVSFPKNDVINTVLVDNIAVSNNGKYETKLECNQDLTEKTILSNETMNLDMTFDVNSNNDTISINQNSTIDIITSIENITKESEVNSTILNSSRITEHVKSCLVESLPADISLPEEDEFENNEKSCFDNRVIDKSSMNIEANESSTPNFPSKPYDSTYEIQNIQDINTEFGSHPAAASQILTVSKENVKMKTNEVNALSIYRKEDVTISSEMQDIVVPEKEVESQNPYLSNIDALQVCETSEVDHNKEYSELYENETNTSTNVLETTINVNKLADSGVKQTVTVLKQSELPTLEMISKNVYVANTLIATEEEVIISENNSPYVSLSAAINEPECQQHLVTEVETQCDSVSKSPPPSPKIISRGNYNFNFDEIDDPFANKTKIRKNVSPEKENDSKGETVCNVTQEIKVSNKTKPNRTPQQYKRKSENHSKTNPNTPKNNISEHIEAAKKYEESNTQIDNFENSEIIPGTSKPNLIEDSIQENHVSVPEDSHASIKHTEMKDNIFETNETDKPNQHNNTVIDNFVNYKIAPNNYKQNLTADIIQENVVPISDAVYSESIERHDKVMTESIESSVTKASSYEEKNCMTPSSSSPIQVSQHNSSLSKNVFNLPEIEELELNPFATVSKMRHSLDKYVSKEESSESNEDLNCTSSSRFTDGKNITVKEVDTEDEDTIEGPFLEADDLNSVDKVSDNSDGEKVDMIQFSNINNDGLEENEEGEMFIDAEAFEFLLNQNKPMVADSGKESLFLKFDPLFAKRMSVAKTQHKQSLNKNPKMLTHNDSTLMDISSMPGPSNVMDMSYDITNDATYESLNSTITKPTMVVTPAVNCAVTPRNKSVTPTRSSRRSFTFTSPAIAVIDRLLSMSANNSILGQDSTLVHVSNEQHEAELALTQLRELLAEKEISVHQLKCESNELKYRLENLESQMKKLEEESKQRLDHINTLNEKLADKTRDNKNMAEVLEEYERTIASLIAEKEQEKRLREEERMKLIRERDEQTAHLANMECSFNDLHSKYEKSKGIIMSYKANEDTYRKTIKDFETNFAKVQNNYDLLKQHATSKLNHANQELEKINRNHEADILKMHAMLKRKELEVKSLEESLAQKTKANDELTAICDELINKVGN